MDEDSKVAWCIGRGLPRDLVENCFVTFTPSKEHEILKIAFSYEADGRGVVSPLNVARVEVELERTGSNLPWEYSNDVSLSTNPLNHTHL